MQHVPDIGLQVWERGAQGACLEEDKMLLITEFMDGGDLHKAIAKRQVSWHKRCAADTCSTCVRATGLA